MSENKALRITVGLTPEERDFLDLLQHEDAAANLSQAVAWCIDSCIKIEKLYGIDACYVAYNDIRNQANDPNPPASPPAPAIDIPLSAKTKEEIIKRGPWYLVQIGEGMEQVGREAMLRENVLDAMEEYAQRQMAAAIEGKDVYIEELQKQRDRLSDRVIELQDAPTPPEGAEGGIKEVWAKGCQEEKRIATERKLSVANTRIAALEAEISRQISLKDHCLITMYDMKKAREKVEVEKEDYRKGLQNFVDKVDRGEAKSKRSYTEMKNLLIKYSPAWSK